jgi:hypothetical protein
MAAAFRCARECVFVCPVATTATVKGSIDGTESKTAPRRSSQVGVGSGGGAIQGCDAIKYDGKLWLVPQWLDEPGRGTTKTRRIIRIDLLPHQPMTNPSFGLDFILNGPLPKTVLDGVATPEQAAQYGIVELPEIEISMPQSPAKQN